jgi:hypothetical protein
MILTGTALITVFIVAFLLGQAFATWALGSRAATSEQEPPAPPATLFDRYAARSRDLSKRAFLNGIHAALHGWPPAPALLGHVERGEPAIKASAFEISVSIAQAYVEGVHEVRRALGQRTGIHDRALDEAVALALEEVIG